MPYARFMHAWYPGEGDVPASTRGGPPWWAAIVILCMILFGGAVHAQDPEPTKDTTETIYEKIERFSQKRKITQWIHSTIFVPPEPEKKPPAPAVPSRRVNPYDRFSGRIIRHIEIDVLDPFGYTVEDTTAHATNRIQDLGNRLHIRTRPVIVRNILLMRPGDRLDPLKVVESERLLRTSPAVSDARIMVRSVGVMADSVDVVVRVLDRWSIDVGADGDLSSAQGRATERNFLGLGHELEQRMSFRYNEQFLRMRGHHRIYNIANTYISSLANYEITERRDNLGIALNRPFYSPLAAWAGGISLNKTWIRSPVRNSAGEIIMHDRIDPVNLDTWVAKSFPMEREGPESGRVSRLVVGARFTRTRYDERPPPERDVFGVFRNNSLVLLGVGLSQRQYYKERYLFRFGLTEDVPEGLLMRLLGGMQMRQGMSHMPYLGAEFARGRNYDGFGYFSYDIAYGTFLGPEGIFDGTFRSGFTYFTDLAQLGRWHLRQFVRAQSVMGFSKPAFSRLTLNVEQMYGFQSNELTGSHRTLFNFETVGYAPWDLIGFRIAPVLLMGFGILGEENEPYLTGRAYSSFTLGILVRNERLWLNTFEVALSFYPFIPEEEGALWRHNAFTNFNVGTRGFDFVSPHIIGYH